MNYECLKGYIHDFQAGRISRMELIAAIAMWQRAGAMR